MPVPCAPFPPSIHARRTLPLLLSTFCIEHRNGDSVNGPSLMIKSSAALPPARRGWLPPPCACSGNFLVLTVACAGTFRYIYCGRVQHCILHGSSVLSSLDSRLARYLRPTITIRFDDLFMSLAAKQIVMKIDLV